jgi:phosphonate transport system substrate-binding protein
MHLWITLLSLLMMMGVMATPFTLDSRFIDADGDMVADTPKDPKQQIDPRVLIFSYTPVEDPAVYENVWQEFLVHLEKTTGKKVRFFPVDSNAAQIEAMRAGRLHVAGFNTGSNPIAVACAGFVPFAIMADANGEYGYEMEIITHPNSGIKEIADLKGRTLAFTSPTSNSGFKAPSALLAAEFGLKAEVDFKTVFSGKHDNSILGVVNRDYDAAAIANSVLKRMIARGVVPQEAIVSIYRSQTFPTTGYGYVYNLKPELQEKIRQAFFTFDWTGTALAKEFAADGESQFIPINFKEHWQVIRTIDAAMGVQYTCR